nr:MAG TPA: hypothetical protein [Caudoviricetes sp.]
MHFCSVLHFAKANHNRATICLSFAHLLYSAQFFAITTSFYSVPLLYFTFLFRASPIRIFALPYFANALHFFTTHCSAALSRYLTMRSLSLLCQNVSTLFNSITLPFCTSQYHSDTLLCYASPKQIITQQLCAFALPIITTFSHAVAYFVISVHLKRPLPEFRH